MPRLVAGQFCFCGHVGRSIDVDVDENGVGGLLEGAGGEFFVVDGDRGTERGRGCIVWFRV